MPQVQGRHFIGILELVWRATRKGIAAIRKGLRLHHNQKQNNEEKEELEEKLKIEIEKTKPPFPLSFIFPLPHMLNKLESLGLDHNL